VPVWDAKNPGIRALKRAPAGRRASSAHGVRTGHGCAPARTDLRAFATLL